MNYAIRSLAEVVTCLYKAQRRNYLDNDKFNELYASAFHLMNMMNAFKIKLINNLGSTTSDNGQRTSNKKII